MIVFHDITTSRAGALRMALMAQHDYLTRRPNRLLLCERLALAIKIARRPKKMVGLLFLDLENFKQVNYSLEHAHRLKQNTLRPAASRWRRMSLSPCSLKTHEAI